MSKLVTKSEIPFGRYEYINEAENSKKYWQITDLGSEVEIRWGRIGSGGDSQIKDYAHAAKKVREKIKKGYELVRALPQKAEFQKPNILPKPKNKIKVAEEIFDLEDALAKLG